MPQVLQVTSNFNSGSIDPLLAARVDIEQYYQAVQTATNVVSPPQGGLQRRPGLEYQATLQQTMSRITGQTITAPNGGTTANANDDDTTTLLTTTTGISTTDPYVVVHYDLGSSQTIEVVDVKDLALDSGSVDGEFKVQYSTDDIAWNDYGSAMDIDTTATDHIRGGTQAARYWRIARDGTTDLTTSVAQVSEFNLYEYSGTTSQARVIGFSFNTEQDYILAFTDRQIEIFKDGVSQTIVVSPYIESDLFDLDLTQSADTAIIVDEDYEPRKLTRTSDTDWTLATITFLDVPLFDYADSLSPTPTSEIQDLTFGSFGNNRIYRLELDGLLTEELDYSNTDTSDNENIIRRGLEQLATIPAGDVTVEFQSGTTYRITFANGASDDWPLLLGRVVLGSGSVTAAEIQAGTARKEVVWSDTRGWPRTATFHEGRLWFGGTKGRPQTMFGSVAGDFFNFYTGEGNAADAIVVTLDTDQVNAITAVNSARHFQVFTTGAEFYVPTPEGQPITPESILFRRVTQHGTRKIRPVLMDGTTIFVERRGKIIREFIYEFAEEGYTAPSASLLSSHLINGPVDMDALRGTDSDQANYVWLVNDDGTLAVFNILRNQDVNTWTNWTTDGLFESVAVIDDETYFVINRTLDGTTLRFLEKANWDRYTDSSVIYEGSATDTITGLDHLDNEECRVRADGSVLANVTPSGGSATIERTGTDVEIGLDFNPTIETLPPASNFQEGNTYRRKRIVRAAVNVHETLGVKINGEEQPDRAFGGDVLDDAPTPFTGQFEVFVLGWEDFPTLTITQSDPVPMYLRQLVQEVHVA